MLSRLCPWSSFPKNFHCDPHRPSYDTCGLSMESPHQELSKTPPLTSIRPVQAEIRKPRCGLLLGPAFRDNASPKTLPFECSMEEPLSKRFSHGAAVAPLRLHEHPTPLEVSIDFCFIVMVMLMLPFCFLSPCLFFAGAPKRFLSERA